MLKNNSHIFLITFIIGLKSYIEGSGYLLICIASLLTYIFINTNLVWLGFLLWEVISIISAILIWNFEHKNLDSALKTLFISLLSGACYLFAIIRIPFNLWFTSLEVYFDFYSQIALTFAVIIKSGLFPFIWPQIASVASYNVSASLHSVTAIQLGIYLCAKIKLYTYSVPQRILSIFCVITVAYSFIYLICEKSVKKRLACLTQSTNAGILYYITTAANPDIYSVAAFHGMYKSLMFLCLDPRYGSRFYKIIFIFASAAGSFIEYIGHAAIAYVTKSYNIFFMIKALREWKISSRGAPHALNLLYKTCLACMLLILIFTAVKLPIKLHLISLGLAIVQLGLSEVKFREYWDLPIIDYVRKLLIYLFYLCLALFIGFFVYNNADLGNFARLVRTKMQVISLIPFSIGLLILWRAQNKIQYVVGLNVISAVIAVLLSDSIDLCATHIAADVIGTIVILRSRHDIYAPQSRKYVWVIPVIFIIIILVHKQTPFDLKFPKPLNTLNDIVTNWRLFDTLGEILVFSLTRFCW